MADVSKAYDAHVLKIDADANMLSAEVSYIVTDCRDESEALQAVHRTADSSFEDVPLANLEIEERLNDRTFRVKVNYEKTSSNAASAIGENNDKSTVSFDCGGGTKHVVRAISHRHWGSHDSELIGWNGKTGSDMQIAGVDIPTAQMRESYTTFITYGELIARGFKRQIASYVGTVNNKEFFGWQPGELMFLGAAFSNVNFKKLSEKLQVTFNFAVQLNEQMDGIVVSGSTHSITKDGFEYVWLIPKTEVANGVPVTSIDDFFVAKVCEGKSFDYIRSFL